MWWWFYNVMKIIDIFTMIGNAILYNWDNFIILVSGKKDRILFNTFHAWSTLKRKMRHIKKGIGLKQLLFHVVSMRSYIILLTLTYFWSLVLTPPIGGVFSVITRVDFWLLLGVGVLWIFLQASIHFICFRKFLKKRAPSNLWQYFSMNSVSDLILNSLEKTVLKVEQ